MVGRRNCIEHTSFYLIVVLLGLLEFENLKQIQREEKLVKFLQESFKQEVKYNGMRSITY
jgi:hypothetical protein